MQRFKNLTKKSGKVASAILSAAMVTSMVLGTNVVEVKAATNDAETTADVKKINDADPTAEELKDLETAKKAVNFFTQKVKDLPVTSNTAVTYASDKPYEVTKAAFDAQKKYAVTFDAITFTVKTAPTAAKEGKLVLSGNVQTPSDPTGKKTPFEIEYKLDNLTKRAQAAAALVQAAVDDATVANNEVSAGAIVTELNKIQTEKTYSDKPNSLKTFDDIVTFTIGDVQIESAPAEEDKAGSVEGTVTVKAGSDSNVGVAQTTYKRTLPSFKEQMKTAGELMGKVIFGGGQVLKATDETTGAINATASPRALDLSFTQQMLDYLSAQGVEVATVTAAAVDADSVVAPTKSKDGSAKVNVKIELKNGYTETFKDQEYTLYNNSSLVAARFEEVQKAAEQVDADEVLTSVGSDASAQNVQKAFVDAFVEKFNDTQKEYLGNRKLTSNGSGDITADQFKTFYNMVNVDFAALQESDASEGETGDYTVTYTVSVGTDAKKTGKVTLKAQTKKAKIEAAIDSALDEFVATNDTTADDVKVAVEAAVASFDEGAQVEVKIPEKTKATSEAEGSLVVEVKATVDGEKVEMSKTLTIAKLAAKGQFVEKDGKKFYYGKDGQLLKNTFLQGTESPDGYTYYIQNDGSVMQDRLTYHPNGKDVIYFDAEGHEVFDAFVNVKKDVQGNAVDYIGYFGTLGGAYVNQTTYGNGVGAYSKDALFYINDYGVLENKGWFQNAAGNIGYAAANGTLTTNQWSLDQFGRKVYFQADGFLAKGLITDGVKYYQLDETDGHLVGEF